MRKRILFITGTRADYGKIKSLMKIVQEDPNFELFVFVTGMHLSRLHGSTYLEVQRDGWPNIQIDYASSNHDEGMAQKLASIVSSLSNYIREIQPDLTVVHGDRIEALSGAISASLQNVRTAHIEGGEVTGTIDESIRHAITKLSHEHLVASDLAKERLLRLGEERARIHVIGSPDIDVMMSENLPSLSEVKRHYQIKFEEFFIAALHPVTTDLFSLKRQAEIFVDALVSSKRNGIVIYPNNDLGHEVILSEYDRLRNIPCFKIFPSVRFEYFLTLLKNCQFIVGNSSAGIREAGIYGIPAIDIGTRQSGRYNLLDIKNIQHVDFKLDSILKAIDQTDAFRQHSMTFGDGRSASKFWGILTDPSFWERPIQKKITY